jgi:hypothetical protein
MLRKLLRRLTRDRATIEAGALARELGVSVQEIREMIETLERLGYIERIVLGCTQPCERCSLQLTCSLSHSPRLWTVTSKGEKCLSPIDDGV